MQIRNLVTGLLGMSSMAAASGDGFVKMDFGTLSSTPLDALLEKVISSSGLDLSSLLDPFHKRGDSPSTINLKNQKSFYSISLGLGTPAQTVSVLIDTGSSDLWVMSAENPECKDNGGKIDCDNYGTFDQDNSTSWSNNGTSFSIQYYDQTYARGTFGQDDVVLTNNLKVKGANFAVANDSDSDVAVFGIGFQNLESPSKKYVNVPSMMKDQGLINKVAYSLYLTSEEAANGSIIFGGIDEAKYSGDLTEIDIVKSSDGYDYLQIPLNSISVHVVDEDSTSSKSASPSSTAASSDSTETSDGGLLGNILSKRDSSVDTDSVAALLDSGTTYTILPDKIVKKLATKIQSNATYNDQLEAYVVDCSLRNTDNYLTFNFDGKADIKVPMSNVVSQAGTSSGGATTCMLTIMPGSDSSVTLGDNFLRSAYSVFNLEDKTISIAQIKYSDDQKITVIQ